MEDSYQRHQQAMADAGIGKDEVDGVTRFHSLVWHRVTATEDGVIIED